MLKRIVFQRKVLLPLLLLVAIVAPTWAANAQGGAVGSPASVGNDPASVDAAIHSGRLRQMAPGTRVWTGVWTGCHFVFLSSQRTEYKDGATDETIGVFENPDAMPPNAKECPTQARRNPTQGEMIAMRQVVAARNGLPGPPKLPEGAFTGTP